jgi:hypothetical protein
MKRVKITHKDGRKFENELADPTAWIAQESANNSWGLAERTVEAIQGTFDPADVLEEIPEVTQGDVTVSPAMVRLKAEYTIEITDIAEEIQERTIMQAVIEARAFGEQLINKMSARNALKPNWDVAKTLAYINQTESAMKLLQAGALETALSHIESLQPSAELTQNDITFATLELENFLGL